MKMRTPGPLPVGEVLVGWKEIADYLGVGIATARRWGARARWPLPYHVTLDHPWASVDEVQIWLRQNTIPGQEYEARRSDMIADDHASVDTAEKTP